MPPVSLVTLSLLSPEIRSLSSLVLADLSSISLTGLFAGRFIIGSSFLSLEPECLGVSPPRLPAGWIELSLITSILSLSAKLENAVVDFIRSEKNFHGYYWYLVRGGPRYSGLQPRSSDRRMNEQTVTFMIIDVPHLLICSRGSLSGDRPCGGGG